MEEYMVTENEAEMEFSETDTDAAEDFMDTVSGNDAGTDAGEIPVLEENTSDTGQDEILERLDALVEVLTPGEEGPEEDTDMETETVPSETETAILELLERIYAETAESRTADTIYYEAWAECQTTAQEKADTQFAYTFVTQIVLIFLCAVIAGLLVAKIVWERFK